jgi:hypothetical protein
MTHCKPEEPDIVLVVPELADLSEEHHAALGAVCCTVRDTTSGFWRPAVDVQRKWLLIVLC